MKLRLIRARRLRWLYSAVLCCCCVLPSYAQDGDVVADLIARGMASRQQGQIRQAIDAFEQARSRAQSIAASSSPLSPLSPSSPQTAEQALRAAGELGVTLM